MPVGPPKLPEQQGIPLVHAAGKPEASMRALYQKEVAVGVSPILFCLGLLCLGLAGCGGGSTDPDSTATDDSVGVAYVRRPNSLTANPTDSFSTETGGDL